MLYRSKPKILFEFLDPNTNERILNLKPRLAIEDGKKAKMKDMHQPILVEKEQYEVAYVAEDEDNEDSFLVVLTHMNGDKKFPKLIKFTKNG